MSREASRDGVGLRNTGRDAGSPSRVAGFPSRVAGYLSSGIFARFGASSCVFAVRIKKEIKKKKGGVFIHSAHTEPSA